MGKINITECTPSQIGSSDFFLGKYKVLKFTAGEGEVDHRLLIEECFDAALLEHLLVGSMTEAERSILTDVCTATWVGASHKVEHSLTVSNTLRLSREGFADTVHSGSIHGEPYRSDLQRD